MKLSELTIDGQAQVRRRIENEQRSWDNSAIWWKGDDKVSPACQEMKAWYAAFQKFSAAVFADEDIDAAFKEWSGQDSQDPDIGQLSSPKYGFWETFRTARIELRISQEFLNQAHAIHSPTTHGPH
jgi:hypothetical protein